MRSASAIFANVAPNMMTPNRLSLFEDRELAIELSEGTGFDHEPIFGVTVVDRRTERLSEEWAGRLFRSREEARAYVEDVLRRRDTARISENEGEESKR